MPVIAWTGHRPKDLDRDTHERLVAALDKLGVGERKDIGFITGGALGVDTWAADYALDHGMYLRLIMPFSLGIMAAKWTQDDRLRLFDHMNRAQRVQCLQTERYDPAFYQRRNEAMVDAADVVFAVWTGKRHGGTYNCVRYALKQGKQVFNLWPLDGKLHRIKEIA